jgi:hypothetical protein
MVPIGKLYISLINSRRQFIEHRKNRKKGRKETQRNEDKADKITK